jgi:hypothetical protein
MSIFSSLLNKFKGKKSEINSPHGTLFVETKGEKFESRLTFRGLAIDLMPPLLLRYLKKILRR